MNRSPQVTGHTTNSTRLSWFRRATSFNLLLVQLHSPDGKLQSTDQLTARSHPLPTPASNPLLQAFPHKPQRTTEQLLDGKHTLTCYRYRYGTVQQLNLARPQHAAAPDITALIQKVTQQKLAPVQQILLVLPMRLLTEPEASQFEAYWQQLQHYLADKPRLKFYLCISECQQLTGFSEQITPLLKPQLPQIMGGSSNSLSSQAGDNTYHAYARCLDSYRKQIMQSLHTSNNNYHILQQLEILQRLNDCQQTIWKLCQAYPLACLHGVYFSFTPTTAGNTHTNCLTHGMWHDILAQQLNMPDVYADATRPGNFISRYWRRRKQTAQKHITGYHIRSLLLCGAITLAVLVWLYPNGQRTWVKYSTLQAIQPIPETPAILGGDRTFNTILQHFAGIEHAQQRYFATTPTNAALSISLRQRQDIIQSKLNKLILQSVMPYLRKSAQHTLQQAVLQQQKSTNHALAVPEQLFAALKIYLMLSQQAQHRDASQISSWLVNNIQTHGSMLTTQQSKNISQLVRTTLKTRFSTAWLAPEANLVQQARKILQQTPLAGQALAVIANSYHPALTQSSHTVRAANAAIPEPKLQTLAAPVSPIYLHNQFNTIYQQVIPAAAQILLQQNWIINNPLGVFQNLVNNPDFSSAIKALYLQTYIDGWKQRQHQLQHITLHSTQDIIRLLQQLADKNSQFSQQVMQIILNTAPIPQATTFNQIVSPGFASLPNAYLDVTTDSPLAHNIERFIKKIKSLRQSHKKTASLDFMLQRVQHQSMLLQNIQQASNHLAAPYQNILNHLLTRYYSLLLQKASTEVDQAYQQQLYPSIKQHLLHLYPIDIQAKLQLSAKTFADFFKTKGILDLFFQQYLSPFIDQSKANWRMKTFHGIRLKLSQAALINWQQTQHIKHQYFNKKHLIDYSFKIKPVSRKTTSPQLKLTLAGQSVNTIIKHKQIQDVIITWRAGSPALSMTQVQDHTKKPKLLSYTTGPWSWLKLIRQAHPVSMKKQPTKFSIYFVIGHNHLHYYIVTSQSQHTPFMHGLLGKASFPASLIGTKN